MLTPSQAGFRRLLPLLRPHLRQLLMGGLCMLIYVGSFPLLVRLAGELFPALGSQNLSRVLQLIVQGVLIFAVQKLAQFCLLYTSPSPRDLSTSRMPSSA